MADLYLVTGGAGFIGSHVVETLLHRGRRVRVFDNFSTGRRENLTGMLDDVELVEGDLRSYERAHTAVRGVRHVIHLAALPSVPRSVQDPLTTNEVNVTGSLNVLLAARDADVERVVLASSSSVYGANAESPKRETLVPQPISPYGVSKLAAEQYAMAFHDVYKLQTVALRYFNVFGPRQDPTSQYSGVVPLFIRCAMDGRRPVIYGDGLQTRDFTYVANVVDATLSATTAPGAAGGVMNIGCGDPHALLELISAIEDACGRSLEPESAPERAGDVKHSCADISRAAQLLSYRPKVDFAEGVRLTYQSMRKG
jgi:UDP-glucose 4-epimerase